MLPNPLEEIARKLDEYDKRLSHLERLEGAGAWSLIEDIELSAPAANFDFTAIPATFETLVLFASLRDALAITAQSVFMTLNGDVGNNYDSLHRVLFNGGNATSERLAQASIQATVIPGNTAPANSFGSNRWFFYDYRDASNFKGVDGNGGHLRSTAGGGIRTSYIHGDWRSTAVIDQITLVTQSGSNFMAGSRCTLYGISL